MIDKMNTTQILNTVRVVSSRIPNTKIPEEMFDRIEKADNNELMDILLECMCFLPESLRNDKFRKLLSTEK